VELRTYLTIIWRRKWVIVATVVVTMLVIIIGTLLTTPTYLASTTLRIKTPIGGAINWLDYNITYADRLMNTYAEIATSSPTMEKVAQRLNLNQLPQVSVKVLPNTELMKIVVEDANPSLTASVANTLAEILVTQDQEQSSSNGMTTREILSAQLAQVEEELNQARQTYEKLSAQLPEDAEPVTAASYSIELKQQTYATLLEQYEQARVREAMQANTLSVVEPAVTPLTPSEPHKVINIALGLMVGLAGGLGLAFVLESLDTRLYTSKQIEAVTELPALGQIPTVKKVKQFTLLNGNSPQGEAFRYLRTNILTPDLNVPLQTLLITSTEPAEGKSTVVANLALTTAQFGRKVISIDCDLRRPTLHRIFDLPNKTGLSDVLKGETTLDRAIQSSKLSGVKVLTTGPLPSNPVELLGSIQMTTLLKQLKQQFDLVLLDTPALSAVVDAAVLAPTVDGVLLVVGCGQTLQEAVQAAHRQLVAVKAKLIGVVVNRTKQANNYYYASQVPRSMKSESENCTKNGDNVNN